MVHEWETPATLTRSAGTACRKYSHLRQPSGSGAGKKLSVRTIVRHVRVVGTREAYFKSLLRSEHFEHGVLLSSCGTIWCDAHWLRFKYLLTGYLALSENQRMYLI